MRVFTNGVIHTMDRDRPGAEAMAVENGRFVFVGSQNELSSYLDGRGIIAPEQIDLDGRPVLPGFFDSHLHLLSYGYSLEIVDLNGCRSAQEIGERLQRFIAERKIPKDCWIQGRGWNQEEFETKEMPNCDDIDRVSPDNPVILNRVCGQSCLVNSVAIATVFDKLSESEIGNAIEAGDIEAVDGEPTGIVNGNGRKLFFDAVPPFGVEAIKRMIKNGCSHYRQKGITSVETDDFELVQAGPFTDILQAYRELDGAGELAIRVEQMLYLPRLDLLKQFLTTGHRTGDGSDFFTIGRFKLSIDGSLGAGTAALLDGYADNPDYKGILTMEREEISRLVRLARDNGLRVVVDTIGDRAITLMLDIYKDIYGEHAKDARPALDHCQVNSAEIIARFRDEQVLAGLEMIFVATDKEFADKKLGPGRARSSYAWKSFIENGVPVAMGSDSPVENPNPFLGIAAAVNRCSTAPDDRSWNPEQCLSVYEAIHAATMGAAYHCCQEEIKGSISVGKYADFIVLDQDPFLIEKRDLHQINVLATYVDGSDSL